MGLDTKKARKAERSRNVCVQCDRSLGHSHRALFVEEEVGRTFCTEDCIVNYFGPEIEKLEKDYFSHKRGDDLSNEQRKALANLRWLALNEPNEVWRRLSVSGDYHYHLISEIRKDGEVFWCVNICLFLYGEPSFLFLSFMTKSPDVVSHYRVGEKMEWVRPQDPGRDNLVRVADRAEGEAQESEGTMADGIDSESYEGEPAEEAPTDGLAAPWTEDEIFRARMAEYRSEEDIAPSEFGHYEQYLEPTLEHPDELWTFQPGKGDTPYLYHFIKRFEVADQAFWYVAVGREMDVEDQIEVLDCFPTQDANFVERFRCGTDEMGTTEIPVNLSRVVH